MSHDFKKDIIVNDEYFTPVNAVIPLIRNINLKEETVIWEITGSNSNITKVFRSLGFTVMETHIDYGFDFLVDEPLFDFDVIVTNPPYSLKNQFLKRCYDYDKPFALLLPLTTFETKKRGEMFREKGIDVIIIDKRIQYKEGGSNMFNTSWFCYKLLKEKLIFWELDTKTKYDI